MLPTPQDWLRATLRRRAARPPATRRQPHRAKQACQLRCCLAPLRLSNAHAAGKATSFLVGSKFLFELSGRYTPLKWLGKGAYGVVCSATDGRTGGRVAIKKIANAFENATDARRTLREIRLLRHLRHENVVALLEVLAPARVADLNDVYLVYELMDTDLHQIIRSPQPLTDEHCQYFVYQARTRWRACLAHTARMPAPRGTLRTPATAHRCCAGSSTSTARTCCTAT